MRPAASRLVVLLLVLGATWALAASGVVSRVVDLLAFGRAPGPADSVVRRSAADLECPDGTREQRAEEQRAGVQRADARDGGLQAVGCARVGGAEVAGAQPVLDGPYLELFPDGTTARQGTYARGLQVGEWVSWTPGGEIATVRTLHAGESSRHLPRPEDLCPPGTTKHRSLGHDHRRRMWSHCTTPNGPDGPQGPKGQGTPVYVGPYVTWDEEQGPGGKRYLLREITTYRDGERHGPHRVYEGAFQREALVEDEVYADGRLEGESRGFYRDGTPRELRSYRGGELDGVRIGYAPDGSERWQVTYAAGHRVAATGDLTVAGAPCSESTVPTFAADGRSVFCARRYLHFLERSGPYVEWGADGAVVESGRYEGDEKVELWTAPAGVELPPKVSDEVLVAEIELLVGDQAYVPDLSERPAGATEPIDIWFRDHRSKKYLHPRTAVRESVVEVYGLPPGSYYMKVEIDANPANELQWPGDLMASVDFRVEEREITRQPAHLLSTLRLLAPWDNAGFIPGWRYPCRDVEAVLRGPVRFAWQPPAVAAGAPVDYLYQLTRHECDGHRRLEQLDGAVTETELELDLPPSRPGEVYQWSLVARVKGQAVGQLMTFGEGGGYGWSVSFRVE